MRILADQDMARLLRRRRLATPQACRRVVVHAGGLPGSRKCATRRELENKHIAHWSSYQTMIAPLPPCPNPRPVMGNPRIHVVGIQGNHRFTGAMYYERKSLSGFSLKGSNRTRTSWVFQIYGSFGHGMCLPYRDCDHDPKLHKFNSCTSLLHILFQQYRLYPLQSLDVQPK